MYKWKEKEEHVWLSAFPGWLWEEYDPTGCLDGRYESYPIAFAAENLYR